jgi:uncharacterized protein
MATGTHGVGKAAWALGVGACLMAGLVAGLGGCQPGGNSLGLAPQTLVVTGRGLVDTPRNASRVSLGVQAQGATPESVQQEIADKANAVVKLLQGNAAVKNLQTSGINLNPTFKSEGGKQGISGYSGSNTVNFEIAPDKIGKLLDQAIGAGATKIDGVSLVADDAAIATAQQTAIARAAEDAQKQTESVLKALNLKQAKVVSIQINGAQVPMFQGPQDLQMLKQTVAIPTMAAANTPVVAGLQRVEATVTLQVKYQ